MLLLGFLLFPVWWVAALFLRMPHMRVVGDEKGVSLDDPQIEHDAKAWAMRSSPGLSTWHLRRASRMRMHLVGFKETANSAGLFFNFVHDYVFVRPMLAMLPPFAFALIRGPPLELHEFPRIKFNNGANEGLQTYPIFGLLRNNGNLLGYFGIMPAAFSASMCTSSIAFSMWRL
ncbi:hypothetical protein EDB19DRAFT_1827877 [Suillus lakei]|nr:hypothetical protein EDB19DRAFT_1827877 [Suillus lakei]